MNASCPNPVLPIVTYTVWFGLIDTGAPDPAVAADEDVVDPGAVDPECVDPEGVDPSVEEDVEIVAEGETEETAKGGFAANKLFTVVSGAIGVLAVTRPFSIIFFEPGSPAAAALVK